MALRDALAAAWMRIDTLERALEEAAEERRRLLAEIDRLSASTTKVAPAPPVDPVRQRHDFILEVARSRQQVEIAALLHQMVQAYPEHDLTLELLDRVRCNGCDGPVTPTEHDTKAHDSFFRGLCPTCGTPWLLLP